MKRKTRNLLVLLCLMITCCCLSFSSVSALAMIKNTPVATDVLTSENIFNAAEWATDGETANDTFKTISYGKRTALYDYRNSHFGHIIAFEEITVDDYVEFSIDVYGMSEIWFYLSDAEDGYWCPRNMGYDNDYAGFYFESTTEGAVSYKEFKKPVYTGDTITSWRSTVSGKYSDKELTTTTTAPAQQFNYYGVSYNVKYFADSEAIYYSWTPINKDGTYQTDKKVEFYTKSTEAKVSTTKKYYAGIQISAVSGETPSSFDKLSIKNGDNELVKNYNNENLDWCVNKIPTEADGSVFVGHYKSGKIGVFEDSEFVVTNAKSTDKLYAYDKLTYDEKVDNQFRISGEFQFKDQLDSHKAFGLVLGLDTPSQAINEENKTFIGFENRVTGRYDNSTQLKMAENTVGTGYIIPLTSFNVTEKIEASFDIESFSRFIVYLAPTDNYFTGAGAYYDAPLFKNVDGKLTSVRNNSGFLFKDDQVAIDGNNFSFVKTVGTDNKAIIDDISNGLNVKVTFYSNNYYKPNSGYYSVIEYTITPYDSNGALDTAKAVHYYSFGGGLNIEDNKTYRIGIQLSGIDASNPVVCDNVVIKNYTATGVKTLLNKTWNNMTDNINDEQDKVFVGFRKDGGTTTPSVSDLPVPTTHLVVYENGKQKFVRSLGTNVVGNDFISWSFLGDKNGRISATINDISFSFYIEPKNIAGYFAFAAKDDFDNLNIVIQNVEARKYSYKESEASEIGENFNTNYFDQDLWMIKSTTSVKTKPEDQDKVKGLVLEDGKLKFAGTTDNAYFSTKDDYGDVILEFQIEEFFDGILPDKSDSDKPKLVDSWTSAHGYSACYINFGVLSGNGVGSSCMLGILQTRANASSPFNGRLVLQDYKSGVTVTKDIDYNFYPERSGASKTTAVKIIVSRSTITIYVQKVSNSLAPATDRYIKIAEFDGITDVFGRIVFTSTEAGWFNIDNLRVYPIDDPVKKRVDAKIALFEDFKQIPDTPVPYQLDAPVVILNENQISWNKVEGATGYRIRANGFIRDLSASQTSYDFNVNGDYEIVVIALGNGKEILDSDVSNELVFTVGAKDSGLFFLIGGITLGVLAVAGVVTYIIIRKRRKSVVKGSE